MAQSTKTTLDNLADNQMSYLKIVFTDPKSGKQLRISAQNVRLMTESSTLDIGGRSVECEFFCQHLQYSDKNLFNTDPPKEPATVVDATRKSRRILKKS